MLGPSKNGEDGEGRGRQNGTFQEHHGKMMINHDQPQTHGGSICQAASPAVAG